MTTRACPTLLEATNKASAGIVTGGIAGVASLAHHSAWRVCASYGGDSRRRGRVGTLVGIALERNPRGDRWRRRLAARPRPDDAR